MKTFRAAAFIFILSGYLSAQAQKTNPSSINTISWKGTLVDSGCAASHTNGQKGNWGTNRNANATKSLENSSSSHPGTPSIPRYELITEDGKCIPFDLNSSEKVSGLIKIKSDWSENAGKIGPIKVEVVGTINDGTIAVDEIEIKSPVSRR